MQNHSLPHHKLIAYGVALELLQAVRDAGIRDSAVVACADRLVAMTTRLIR